LIDSEKNAKIADFGISSVVDIDDMIKGAEGTYHFMAPEMLDPDSAKKGYSGK